MGPSTVQPANKNKSALDKLSDSLSAQMNDVNKTIVTYTKSDVTQVTEVAGYILMAGGKRIRPLLTLAAASLGGYQGDKHVLLAACVEFIHTATLLHDDVVDGSKMRRGRDSVNCVWGNEASVLVGDFLYSSAFEMMVDVGSMDVMQVLARTTKKMSEGEVLQLVSSSDLDCDINTYFKIIEAKTGALFSAAAEVGGLVADMPNEKCQALANYGMNIGLAFQLADDVLDYSADSASLGKNVGDDFNEGKVTLPMILAYSMSDSSEKSFWEHVIHQGPKEGDFERACDIMKKYDVLEQVVEEACKFSQLAYQNLQIFEQSDMKTMLENLTDYCITRTN